MVEQARSWIRENSTLIYFLLAQFVALGAAAAAIIAYATKLEVRVHTMETRGAEYTVARMQEMQQRITVLEQNIKTNAHSIDRIIAIMTRDLGKAPP
jgi:voltage-gated potassium channel Kch